MASKEEIELKVKLIEEIAKRDTSPEVVNALNFVQEKSTNFINAVTANQIADADRISREIIDLVSSAEKLSIARALPSPMRKADKYWPYVGMGVLALVFAGLAWFLMSYADSVGFSKIATIEGTRPLLVIAAIISTIAFGGALLIGSLFSSEGSFEDRFRHSREIFLVFSGIFGTVIGFYFGAGESKGTQIGIDALLEDSTVVAYATGGTPPYKINVTYGKNGRTKTEETKTGWAKFVFDKKVDNIVPFKVSATDSKNVQGNTSMDLNKDELKKSGWALLDDSSSTNAVTKPEPAKPIPPAPPTPVGQKGATPPAK